MPDRDSGYGTRTERAACCCSPGRETPHRSCPVHGKGWGALLARAATEPVGLDISDFGDEWCAGFLAGQESVLEEIQAGRLVLPVTVTVTVTDELTRTEEGHWRG